ncbi:MAG: amidohydrolase family protein [Nocardioides sp.]|uniref:amidohydrolase family protein n=1 Tax=Nocardioides sp. TaxID=35761 RepID=UPI0039E275D9
MTGPTIGDPADIIRLASPDEGAPFVLRGATVLTLDPGLGRIDGGDVLVRNGRIAAVAERIGDLPADAVTVDATDCIVTPGFVDGHRHCWQGSLRRLAVDADLAEYLAITHDGVARHYRPEDMYIGNRVALTGALDAGFTTVLDLSHNTRSKAHADAVFDAYRDTGIRAVHASAPPNAYEWEEHWPDDLGRLRDLADAQPLVTLRMAIDMRRVRPVEELMGIARSLGLGITMDGVMGPGSAEELTRLGRQGFLGPDVTLIHATSLSESAWVEIERAGVQIVLATTSDEQLSLAGGVPPVQRALDTGHKPGLSVDVEISLAGDAFTQMRATLLTQRMLAVMSRTAGERQPEMLTNADVLEMATMSGARAVGLADRVGSIAVGKEADLLVISAQGINSLPGGNPVGTVVQGVDRSDIRAVFVGGTLRKWDGAVLGVDLPDLRARAETSRDHVLSAAGFRIGPNGPEGVPELQDAWLREYFASHD